MALGTYTVVIQLEGHEEFSRTMAAKSSHNAHDKAWTKWFESIPHSERIIREHMGDISVLVMAHR